jgi:hypothetical protein
MIKMKNCGDFVMELTVSGAQTTTAGQPTTQTSAIVPFNGRISAIFARLKVAGTTGTQTVDLFQNGTSLTGGGSVLSFASGQGGNTAPTYTTASLTSNPVKVSKGDVLSCLNKTVHTGTAANDLSLYITIERQRAGSFDDAIQTDTIGSDSDII